MTLLAVEFYLQCIVYGMMQKVFLLQASRAAHWDATQEITCAPNKIFTPSPINTSSYHLLWCGLGYTRPLLAWRAFELG